MFTRRQEVSTFKNHGSKLEIQYVKKGVYFSLNFGWSQNTIKWGDIEQFSMFFLDKIDCHNPMGPILQT